MEGMARLGGSFGGSRRESEGARTVGAAQGRRLLVLAWPRGGGSQCRRRWRSPGAAAAGHRGRMGGRGGTGRGGGWEEGAVLVGPAGWEIKLARAAGGIE
jgi:hypothetical protein